LCTDGEAIQCEECSRVLDRSICDDCRNAACNRHAHDQDHGRTHDCGSQAISRLRRVWR
jgi:hypothetical protein